MPLEWISNAERPQDRLPTLRMKWGGGVEVEPAYEYREWFYQFVQGEPQVPPGSTVTVKELKQMGLVGLYRQKEEP